MKKRLRSLTIYQILPRAQDRSWGIKLNIEVHAELLVRMKSLCKNINRQTWVQNVPSKTYIRTSYICISMNKGGGGVWLQQASFDSVAILFYDYEKLLWGEMAHMNPLITTQYTTMDSSPYPYEKAIHSTHAYLAHFRVSTFTCLWTVIGNPEVHFRGHGYSNRWC